MEDLFKTVENILIYQDNSDAPYQVSLQTLDKQHFCSGVIASKDFIVTADDCTVDKTPEEIVVRVGSKYKTVGGELFRVRKIYSDYSLSSERQNKTIDGISLLYLSKSIDLKLSGVKKAAEIPENKEGFRPGNEALVSGWGDEPTIRGAEVVIASEEKCRTKNTNFNSATTLCTENTELEPYFCFG